MDETSRMRRSTFLAKGAVAGGMVAAGPLASLADRHSAVFSDMRNQRGTTNTRRGLAKSRFEKGPQYACRICRRCRQTNEFVECVKLLRRSARQQLGRKKLTEGRIFLGPTELESLNFGLSVLKVAPR